jgi:hypothetical protein
VSRSRAWLALGLAAGLALLLLLPISGASTASVYVPATIIGHAEVHVTGAVLASVNHTLSADGSTITDSAIGFLGKLDQEWVYVRVGADAWTRCNRHGWITTPGEDLTEYRCLGLNEPGSNAAVWIDARVH